MKKKTRSESTDAKRTAGRDLGLLPATLTLVLLAVACSPIQRHAMLDIVFDGVPPYMTPEERARHEAEVLEAARHAEAFARRPGHRELRQGKLSQFVHGPYAAKECERCHDLGAASGFREASGRGAESPASLTDPAEGGRLRMPLVDLCVHCHTDFAGDAANNAGLFMHGPVANGLCVTCHQAHSSPYAALVYAEPPARLCNQCHMRQDLVAFTAEHRPVGAAGAYPPPPPGEGPEEESDPDAQPPPPVVRVVEDCTRCHDPHRGPERTLLKARSRWAPEPVRDVPPDPESAPAPEPEQELSRARGLP